MEVKVQIPKELGLTDEETSQLQESFGNQLIETLRHGEQSQALARPKTVGKVEQVHPEVIVQVV